MFPIFWSEVLFRIRFLRFQPAWILNTPDPESSSTNELDVAIREFTNVSYSI
jgi:hypothetical protein